MFNAAYEECAQAEYTGIALEYGTLPKLDVMLALRADQWLREPSRGRRGDAARDQAAGARRVLHRHRRLEGADREPGRRRGARRDARPRRATAPEAARQRRRTPGRATAASPMPSPRPARTPRKPASASDGHARRHDPRLEPGLHRRLGRQRRAAGDRRDLGAARRRRRRWLINAYLLPLGALVLLGGAAGDRYGRRRAVPRRHARCSPLASLACALAPGVRLLLAGRARCRASAPRC